MKKVALLSAFIFTMTVNLFGQQFVKPSEGKTLVYFVRYQGAVALIDFKYFDGDKYLGRISGNNYFIYECEPGEHVFWLAAENREYIKGNLKPNCTYVIEVRPYMRAVMAGVELTQISPADKKTLKLGKNSTHTFSNNTTTNRKFTNLKGNDKISIRLAVKESDLWPDADENLGVSYYTVPLVDIINRGTYTYTIKNYGAGSSYMDVTFILKMESMKRL